MYLGGGDGINFKSAKYPSNSFAVGYVLMHFVTLFQMPELFVSAFTIMPPIEMTIFVLKLDLWCLVITSFSKVDATTQIMAFMNIYMEINLLDFKFQPEHRLLLLCVHCCITEGYTGLLGPSLGLHPCLFSLTFGLNLGSDCGERMLCGFSTVLAKPLSFHRGRWPPSGTSPCLMLVSHVEVKKFSG